MTIPEPAIKILHSLILLPLISIIAGPLVFILTGLRYVHAGLIPPWVVYPVFQAGILLTVLGLLMSSLLLLFLRRNPLSEGGGYLKSAIALSVVNALLYAFILI